MRAMKDSGIPWIGEIPKDWRNAKYRYSGEFIKGKLPNEQNVEQLGKPIIGASEMLGKECRNFSTDENIPTCQKEDVLILWDGANAGIVANNCEGIVSSTAVKYVCTDKKFDAQFLFYLFKNGEPFFKSKVNGTTIPHMNQKYIDEYLCIQPSLAEQQRIAEFLDRKCAEVDEMIALQEQIIEELKAYKQSVITETVTKGLNPDVSMKDSGIEWIGEIPEHWEVRKLSKVFSFKGGYAFNSDDFKEEGDKQVIRIGNIRNDLLRLDVSPVYISNNIALKAEKSQLEKGQILFTMTGTKGKRDYFYTLLLKDENFDGKELYLNQRVGCFAKKDGVCAGYYNYLLKDSNILDSIFIYETGTANQGNLGIETIKRTMLQYPPEDEQQSIADYLDNKCGEIDELIAIKQSKIDSLKEYKKSIIYEYVTGKREVELV